MKIWKEITHEKYTVEIEEPTLYIDNRKRGRSGHMSHALTEFSPNCLIDFNSNCSQKQMERTFSLRLDRIQNFKRQRKNLFRADNAFLFLGLLFGWHTYDFGRKSSCM